MEEKLKHITEQVYQEGVLKGEHRAEEIIKAAEDQAKKIVQEAETAAAELRVKTDNELQQKTANAKAELQLYAKRVVEALKAEISQLLSTELSKEAAKETADKSGLQGLALRLVEKWVEREELRIDASEALGLKAYFAEKLDEKLQAGIEVNEVNKLPMQFRIGPKDGSYCISFGEEEFEGFFREFLRPELEAMIFKS